MRSILLKAEILCDSYKNLATKVPDNFHPEKSLGSTTCCNPKPHPEALWLLKLPINTPHFCIRSCDSAGDQCLLSTPLHVNTASLVLYKLKSCFHSGCVTSYVNSMENYCSSNWTSVLEVLHPAQLIVPNVEGSLLRHRNDVEKKKGHLRVDKNPLFQPCCIFCSSGSFKIFYMAWLNLKTWSPSQK